MAANLTNSEENRLLDLSLPNGSLYLALFSAAPGEAAGGTELTGSGYARVAIPFANAASGGTKSNSGAVTFAAASGTWLTIVAIAVMDASTAGTMRWYRTLAGGEQRTLATGDQYTVATGALTFSLD
jgi:hypothetical protein